MTSSQPKEIFSDDEDENECRLTCSLRWLITKAYPNGTLPDYLPHSHFFQLEDDERFLTPDIALFLLSGDFYVRAFQQITHQQDQFITYEDLIKYFSQQQKIHLDLDALKQDNPLNANAHLDFIDHFIKLYGQMNIDTTILSHRFEKLQLKSLTKLVEQSTKIDLEAFLIIWLNGIAEHMSNRWSERIPPVIDLRSALIDGRVICALVSYYDEDFASDKKRTDLNYLRFFLNHYRGSTMTNYFPFTVKHLRENLIPDLNLQAMLIDLFVLFENGDENQHPSNLTYSLNDEEEEDEEEQEQEEQEEQPVQTICSTPNKTTWQRQAASNHTTPLTSARTADDLHVNQEYLAVKMQLEMKKRAIERDKQRLESVRDNKRQTISQEAFKQLLQQKNRQTAILNNQQPNNIRKSQTTNEISRPKDDKSIVDLSKPMNRDEFLNALELLKKKYLESNQPIESASASASPSPPPLPVNTSPSPTKDDDSERLEELNSNIGELQQVLTSLSVKQEEIRQQVTQANGGVPVKINGLVMELIDDPSASTVVEMEKKKELVLQRQQQRLEAYEQRRQRREMENHHRDDERRKKDTEDMAKKLEREQRRDEIYRQYLMKKEKKPDGNIDEHPTIKVRSKTTTFPKSSNERKAPIDPPILIAPFGTDPDVNLNETQSLSFVRMAELRPTKPIPKIDSRTLTRHSARSATNEITPSLPLIPISEPRYPLAKPLSGKSNKQTIINALTQVILAGRVNDRHREQVCDDIEKHADKVKHFIILFRDSRLQYRSVYAYIPSTADTPTRLERLTGQGPKEINESMVEIFYKYNNGSKQFSQLPIKSFSVQCDAITISNQYWSQSSATTTTKRTNSTHFNATTTLTSDSNQS